MTNTGMPYEQLAQGIFQQILQLDGLANVKVQHNVKVEGKSVGGDGKRASHQLDVYWEFELGGILYKTAIQAKDWGSNLNQGEVLKFKAVLDDLPGQPRGIIVTRTGYQAGAKQVAESNGIELYELRKPEPKDLAGRLLKIGINFSFFTPSIEITAVEADTEWLRSTGFNGDVRFPATDARTAFLYSEDDTRGKSVFEIVDAYVPKENREIALTEVRHDFKEPTYLHCPEPELPRIKILAITFRYEVTGFHFSTFNDYTDMLTFVLKTVSGDKTYFVDPDNNVRRAIPSPATADDGDLDTDIDNGRHGR